MKAKPTLTPATVYDSGDLAYYKIKNSEKWEGPGKVIEKENKQLLVKHDGYDFRVHPCSLHLIHKSNNVFEGDENNRF